MLGIPVNESDSVRCVWCNGPIGPGEGNRRQGGLIKPPLCQSCAEFLVFQMGVPLQKFLDSLPAPIFMVDNDATVVAANSKGYGLLHKGPEQVLRRLSGQVFECAYARLEQGCGRTVHCSGCAIRRSIYHTSETGESLSAVPATLRRGDADDPEAVTMLISTEKMGNVVLLRIDRVNGAVGES